MKFYARERSQSSVQHGAPQSYQTVKLGPAEALAKAELARRIGALIAKQGLTQTAGAELLKIDQSTDDHLHQCRLSSRQAQLFERGASDDAVGVAERLADLEVVVAIADKELDRFACRPHGRSEVP